MAAALETNREHIFLGRTSVLFRRSCPLLYLTPHFPHQRANRNCNMNDKIQIFEELSKIEEDCVLAVDHKLLDQMDGDIDIELHSEIAVIPPISGG